MIENGKGTLLRVPFSIQFGRLAQLVRVLVSHTRGHWFESSIAHHFYLLVFVVDVNRRTGRFAVT